MTERSDMMRRAAEAISSAWDEASAEGVASDVIAETGVHALFARMLSQDGEAAATSLLEEVRLALNCGHYLPDTAIQ